MKKASNNPSKELIERYQITPLEFDENYLTIPRISLRQDGIIIPTLNTTRSSADSEIILFSPDYSNCINVDDIWKEKGYANQLIYRAWSSKDFDDVKIIKKGIKFGKDLFKTSIYEFHKLKNGHNTDIYETCPILPQSEEINQLGERLIRYYSKLIEEF